MSTFLKFDTPDIFEVDLNIIYETASGGARKPRNEMDIRALMLKKYGAHVHFSGCFSSKNRDPTLPTSTERCRRIFMNEHLPDDETVRNHEE